MKAVCTAWLRPCCRRPKPGAFILPKRCSSITAAPGGGEHTVDDNRTRGTVRWPNSLVTLAIETSCDDTCVAVLEKESEPYATEDGSVSDEAARAGQSLEKRRPRARLLFEERVTADNRAFGGIHPLTSTVGHTAALAPLVQRAVQALPQHAAPEPAAAAAVGGRRVPPKPDFVAATRGPGQLSALATGLGLAKGLAVAWQVPLVGVHHMQAHALTPRLVAALEPAKPAEEGTQVDHAAALWSSPSSPPVAFPYLSLLVSGGHTLLVESRGLADHRVRAAAANIAVGDLLDKCARAVLPRGYIAAAEARAGRSLPYGALLETFAFEADDDDDNDFVGSYQYPADRKGEMAPFVAEGCGWRLEAPLAKSGEARRALRFDFSGLNGAVIKLVGGDPPVTEVVEVNASSEPATEDHAAAAPPPSPPPNSRNMSDDERRLLARATMQLAFEHIASRLLLALDGGGGKDEWPPPVAPTCLVVAGGVASNRFLRRVLRSALDARGHGGLPLVAPPPALCTDNAAMIAWAGMEMYEAGWQTDLNALPIRKWPMDSDSDVGGILGVGGWTRRK